MKRFNFLGTALFGFLFMSCFSFFFQNVASAASPQFNFYCESGNCPQGPYQKSCPYCTYRGPQGLSKGYLQCFCFDDNDSLANATILHKGGCQQGLEIQNNNGKLECAKGSGSPSQPSEPVSGLVDFKFNCVTKTNSYFATPADNCPSSRGNYQQYCPRCNYSESNGNDMSALECACFNGNATMNPGYSYLTTSGQKACKTGVYSVVNGKLACGRK